MTRAVITVPAYFDDAARTATKDAARLAGSDLAWLSPLYANPLLHQSPGRELFMCQVTIAQMDGSFEVYRAEDGRTVTCITLPLAIDGDSQLV